MDLNLDDIAPIDSDDVLEEPDTVIVVEPVVEKVDEINEVVIKNLTPRAVTPQQEVSPSKNSGTKISVVVDITPNPVTVPALEEIKIIEKAEEAAEATENSVEIRKVEKVENEGDKIEELMSQQAINNLLWDDTNIPQKKRPDVNFRISDLISIDNAVDLTTPSSTSLPKNYILKECDAISMIRGVSSCSKDTLMFIDQPGHGLLDSEENGLLDSNRSLWVSF